MSGSGAFAQGGYPYASQSENTWESFTKAWKPILSWRSGLVERATIIGGVSGSYFSPEQMFPAEQFDIPVVTNTKHVVTVYTNIIDDVTNIYYFTNAEYTVARIAFPESLPICYTNWIDGAANVCTAYPVLSQSMLMQYDAFQDQLYPSFCSTSVYRNSGYQYWMDVYTNLVGGGIAPWIQFDAGHTPESKVRIFAENGIGVVYGTNDYLPGWILINGTALWKTALRGFTGNLRLGSANAEPCYTASGFPLMSGEYDTDPNGVYQWTEYDYLGGVWGWGAGFWLSKTLPLFETGDDDRACLLISPTTNANYWTMIGAVDYVGWPWYPSFFAPYLITYNTTNSILSTNWFSAGSHIDGAQVVMSTNWNFRPASGEYEGYYYATNGACSLRYLSGSTNAASVSVEIQGNGFLSQVTNMVGVQSTSETVTITSGTNVKASISTWFSSVTNMVVTGPSQIGASITVLSTNRDLYFYGSEASMWTYNFASKSYLDERIKALRPLRWTQSAISYVGAGGVTWYGESTTDGLSKEDAYAEAVSNLSSSTGGNYPRPYLQGIAYARDYGVDGWFVSVQIDRHYNYLKITNLTPALPHSVDLIANIYKTLPNPYGVQSEFYCDIPNIVQSNTVIVSAVARSTNTGHTFGAWPVATGTPTGDELPGVPNIPVSYGGDPDLKFISQKGFLIDNTDKPFQSIIKWEPSY